MKQFENETGKRNREKLVEKRNLAQRKGYRDKHYHVVDEDDVDAQVEQEYSNFIKGKTND